MSNTSKVFLSYSMQDNEWARKFVERLRDAGIRVWTNEEIELGDTVAEKIEEALRSSDSLVLVMRPENVNSPNVYFEMGAAVAKGDSLIVILADDVSVDQLPFNISRIKFIQMDSPEETAREVEEALVAAT